MTREERQALAAEDRADGEDFDEECDRRYSGATCACGFELYGCPFHDPVAPLAKALPRVLRDAGFQDALYGASERAAYLGSFEVYDDEGDPLRELAAPSVTVGMMRAALMTWRP